MDRATQRMKEIQAAAAEAALNGLIPASLRTGIAAMAEELREQRARIDALEKRNGQHG